MQRTLNIAVLLFLMLNVHPLRVLSQDNWKLHTSKDGIEVYTKHLIGSDYKAVKTVCMVNASLSTIAAVLMDVNRTTEWVYSTERCKILKQYSPMDLMYYAEVGLPWPASNRDFIIRITLTQDPTTKVITIRALNMPTYMSELPSLVRIQRSSGLWTITPVGLHRVRIEYELQVDPGGLLPAWLVNLFAADGPYESFKNLQQQVQKPIYQHAGLSGIVD